MRDTVNLAFITWERDVHMIVTVPSMLHLPTCLMINVDE